LETKGLFGTAHNSFMSCCELFFFLPNTYFQNSFMGEAVFLLLSQRHKLDEARKSSLLQLLPHFSLSTMHEVVGEVILPNTFSKTAQLHLESHS